MEARRPLLATRSEVFRQPNSRTSSHSSRTSFCSRSRMGIDGQEACPSPLPSLAEPAAVPARINPRTSMEEGMTSYLSRLGRTFRVGPLLRSLAIACLAGGAVLSAPAAASVGGHWEGSIDIPGMTLGIVI